MSAHKAAQIRLVFNDHNWDSTSSMNTSSDTTACNTTTQQQQQLQAYQNKANITNHHRNTTNQCQIAQTNTLLDSALHSVLHSANNSNIHIDHQTDHISNMYTANKPPSNTSGGTPGMFHPTWDEWKQRAQLSNEKANKSKHESVSSQHTNTHQHHQHLQHQQQQQQQHLNSTQTKSSCTSYTKEQRYNTKTQRQEEKMHAAATSPILIRNSSTNQLEYVNETSMRPRHYPVPGIDFVAVRPPSPVELSSCTLAKQPGLDFTIDQEAKTKATTTASVAYVENVQQKKIKTILSTRKESAPNLTGWRRCDSDSDSDAQNRLLARASGSIPIEYISIRRDPQPDQQKPSHTKHKKSITTGTNTSSDRGKRIAATNTNQDELPQYNLHVSLDSLLVKTRQEASTGTELKNRNASTETSQVAHKDAGTLTDAEKSPSPGPPPPHTQTEPANQQQVVYTQRKSRYTEWQRPVKAHERTYRLEILAKSPSTKHHSQLYEHHHHRHHHQSFRERTSRVDDDDKIIFGHGCTFLEDNYSRRSGSYPCLLTRPVVNTCGQFLRQTRTAYRPFVVERITFNQPEYELGVMPLKHTSFVDTDWTSEFSEFNNKFKQIFGTENQTANARRYYKYSRTTTENGHAANSFSRAPIVEIPVTPTATLAKINRREIILITHNGALPVTEQYKEYLENEKIVAWFAQNPGFFHPKLIAIPVGFINFHFNLKYYTIIEKFKKYGTKPWNDRKTLLYINFNEKTNLKERKRFLDIFSHFKGVKILKKRLNFEDYFNNLNDAKFVLCPRGVGIDTHRFYETVLMGAIPVVQNSTLISIYNKTNALILPSIENLNETMLINPEHFIKSMDFKRYIMYDCKEYSCSGFGDQLKGLMSTYALSLLTERKLIIRMTSKCDINRILKPNKIDWDFKQIENKKLSKKRVPLNSRNAYLQFKNTTSVFSEYSEIDLIVISSIYDFMKGLSENKHLKGKIESLGYKQENFKLAFQLKNWFDHLFKLTEKFQQKFDYYNYLMKPNKNKSKLICAQIRAGDARKSVEDEKKLFQKFWIFINSTFLVRNRSQDFNYSIFVTSDREAAKIDAKDFFRNKNKVFFFNDTSHHFVHTSNIKACNLVENIIFDFYMLRACDIGVVSHSGYGVLALWNRKEPFQNLFIYTNQNQEELKINYWNRKNLIFVKYSKLGDVYFL
ncbi:hypothetical protein BpHYR1_050390 [Brachionus plicatilis]|uniref:Exostosin GT47 domain-containing protein n=1 Tax=Brachionus plicatilis TaxID=10195 RepID=A0A3M7SCK8_BRAPC|nr:hypothetical protein BpHYR1_050390 [Brachionus plicatilis]